MKSRATYLSWWAAALILASTQSVSAAEIACDYNENSEWPTVQGMVCQDRTPPPAPLLLLDDSSRFSQWPICTNQSSDPDGDGWGWENFRSCIVNTVVHLFPDCVLPGSDPDGDGWGWENEQSCRVKDTDTGASTDIPHQAESDPVNKKAGDPAVIYTQNFESARQGIYSPEQLNHDWHTPLWHLGLVEQRVSIVDDAHSGSALSVKLPANEYGSNGASAFLSELKYDVDSNSDYEELYLSYDVKFSENFEFVRGGKLPGLCGYNITKGPGQGCNTGGGYPDGNDGWSARGMWRIDGALENYVYHAGQQSYYGDSEEWNVKAIPGQWHSVQHRVVLNTVGKADGIIEAWFDGVKVLSKNNFEFRKTDDIRINLFYFSNFFGGADPSWAPSSDQHLFFDNIRISAQSQPGLKLDASLLQDDAEAITTAKSGGGTMFFLPLFSLFWYSVVRGSKR